MLHLPHTSKPKKPGEKTLASRWLLGHGQVTVVPGLIKKSQDEKQAYSVDSNSKPKSVLPLMGLSDDEVGDQRAPVRRRDVHESPQANLSSSFVKEEDILDKCDGNCLTRCKEEALNGSHPKEHIEGSGYGGKDGKNEAEKGRPKQGWCASDDRSQGNPDQTADSPEKRLVKMTVEGKKLGCSHHEDVDAVIMINRVGRLMPFCRLKNDWSATSSRCKV